MKSWSSFGFGLAIGFIVAFVWQNREIILTGIKHKDKLSAAGDVIGGVKELFSGF